MSRTVFSRTFNMSTFIMRNPTWIGHANSIVERNKGNKYIFRDECGEKNYNSFNLERFGDACLEELDIPAWIEDTLTSSSKYVFTPDVATTPDVACSAIKNNISSPFVSFKQEHNYAISSPDEFIAEPDNILPIIDDLLGNLHAYSLDELLDESPLSSLPSSYEEFQNLEHFFKIPNIDGLQMANIMPHMVNNNSIDIAKGNDVSPTMNPPTMIKEQECPDSFCSNSLVDEILSSLGSPGAADMDDLMSPGTSYMSELMSESSSPISWYDGDIMMSPQSSLGDAEMQPTRMSESPFLNPDESDPTSGQSQLLQLLLQGFDDKCGVNGGNSLCNEEELNRILDGDHVTQRDSVSPSSVSITSDDAVVPSKEVNPKKCSPAKSKSKKTQSRFNPYQSTSDVSDDSIDVSSPPPFKQAGPGRKVYKSQEAKTRKMSQNRTAAHRYRKKKKSELGEMEAEADELEETNGKLKTKVEDMGREIAYLKNLMLDVIKAKLVVSDDVKAKLGITDDLVKARISAS